MMTTNIAQRTLRGVFCALLLTAATTANAQLEDKLEELDALLGAIYAGDAVALEQCVAVALAGNANLGSFEESVESGEVSQLRARAQWLPSVSANGSWTKSERTDFDSPIFDPLTGMFTEEVEDAKSQFSSKNGTANATLDVFTGFSRIAGMRRAGADLEANRATLEYQRSVIVQDVSNSYMNLVKAIRKVQVAESSEALALEELERSETYYELGISTRSDVLQQKVNHQNTKLTTVRERNTKRNAFVLLAHSMGIPSSRQFDINVSLPSGDDMVLPSLEPMLEAAQSRRLDLQAARLGVDARGAAVTEARSGFYPGVQVFAQINRNKTESEFRFGSELTGNTAWGIQGQWNIFDRFATKDGTRRAVADKRRAEYNERIAELNIEAEVVSIHNNLLEAIERFSVATQTVEQAEEDLRLARERFRVGAGTSLDVINAQVGLDQAQRDVVDAQTDYAKFRNQLVRATGGALE